MGKPYRDQKDCGVAVFHFPSDRKDLIVNGVGYAQYAVRDFLIVKPSFALLDPN